MFIIPIIVLILIIVAFVIINYNRKALENYKNKVDNELKNKHCVDNLAKVRMLNHSKDIENSIVSAKEFFNTFGIDFKYNNHREEE